MAIVGGSSLIAAAALAKLGEVASIRGFHFLQVIYLVTGALVVAWTPTRRESVEGDADEGLAKMSDGST